MKEGFMGAPAPVLNKHLSADAQPESPGEKVVGLSKNPTNKLVDEIAEVINDESPSASKALNLGFQPNE